MQHPQLGNVDKILSEFSEEGVIQYLDAIANIGERIAGGLAERKAAILIKSTMEGLNLDEVRMEPFQVTKWEPRRTSLDLSGEMEGTVVATPNPYCKGSGSGDIVFIPNCGISDEDFRKTDVEGSIVLMEWCCERSVYHAKEATLNAVKNGAVGVILFDCAFGNFHRKIVVAGNPLKDAEKAYTFHFGGSIEENLIPIPVVSISREDGVAILKKLRSGRVRANLEVEADIAPEVQDFNVVGIINGKSDEWVIFSSHYDAWFEGACDNTVGTAMVLEIAKAYGKVSAKLGTPERSIVFVSYGAEESGGTNLEPWYWVNGSRAFAQKHHEKVSFVLNIDGPIAPLDNYLLHINAIGPETRAFAERIVDSLRLGEKYSVKLGMFENGLITGSDQYPFYLRGVPVLTVNNGRLGIYYHTNHDIPSLLYKPIRFHSRDVAGLIISIIESFARGKFPLDPKESVKPVLDEADKVLRIMKAYQNELPFVSSSLDALIEYRDLLKRIHQKADEIPVRDVISVFTKEVVTYEVFYFGDYIKEWVTFKYASLSPSYDLITMMRALQLLRVGDVEGAISFLKRIPLQRVIPGFQKEELAPTTVKEIIEGLERGEEKSVDLKKVIETYAKEHRETLDRRIREIKEKLGNQ